MGFNDDPEHPIAIAVVIEHGGAGSTHAAPLAGDVMKKAIDLMWE
jgi:cell division protein FtsI/penicillin-binding protein 2